MEIHAELKEQVSILPNLPGIYQFYNVENQIIYIGKAKNLKKRVSSYFTKKHEDAKTRILVRNIAYLKHVIVETEEDALLLENNLIKKFQPRYNVLLKDDKSYPWICVKKENYPRVFSTRNVVLDGSSYFGPYTSVRMVTVILDFLHKHFKLRSCKLKLSDEKIKQQKYKVCLEFHIGKCLAPCVGLITKKNYNETIDEVEKILKGNVHLVIHKLRTKMLALADDFLYEEANLVKEKISLLEKYQNKSAIVSSLISNIDVFSIVDDEKSAYINYLKVNNGAIIQAHNLEIKKRMNETKKELLIIGIVEIRKSFHSESQEIILPFAVDIALSGIRFTIPKIGDKKKLLALSLKNAINFKHSKYKILDKISPNARAERILTSLQKDLKLKDLPVHIECFDNSNLQGTNPVAACVVFKMAKPSKKDYRHFNIQTVTGANDFASMEEVVCRRYKRLMNEKQDLPQLIVIDGGKGQLSSASLALQKLNLNGKIAIIGIAKKLEEIYFPNDSVPIYLDKTSESLKIIQFLRNEAHRFGITFHRKKRSNAFLKSELLLIDGIGEKSVNKLFTSLKSFDNIKNASLEKLREILSKKQAEAIFRYFNPNN